MPFWPWLRCPWQRLSVDICYFLEVNWPHDVVGGGYQKAGSGMPGENPGRRAVPAAERCQVEGGLCSEELR